MDIVKKPRKRIGRIVAVFIAVFLLSVTGLLVQGLMNNNQAVNDSTPSETKAPDTQTEAKDSVVKIAAMGDMLAHDTIIANAKTDSGYDFKKYFNNIKPAYQDSDIVFCNQEGLSSGEDYVISGYPSFNAPTEFAGDLQSGAGCNLINLANNHMGDKGIAAINKTVDIWTGLKPLGFSGANKDATMQKNVSKFEVNGIKFGFVSFADFNNNKSTPNYSVNLYHDEALVRDLISKAKSESDVTIVSMHWGIEDSNTVSSDQQEQVRLLNSLGVDIIIGTGPHVLQRADIYKGSDGKKTVVWYSLGNMLSSQLNINQLIGGIANMTITKSAATKKIKIDSLLFTPTYMHYEWSATDAANGNLLARKNAMIYLLDSAAEPMSKSLFNTSVAAQKEYVIDTIGSDVTIK